MWETVQEYINKDSKFECNEIFSDDDILSLIVRRKEEILKNCMKAMKKILQLIKN